MTVTAPLRAPALPAASTAATAYEYFVRGATAEPVHAVPTTVVTSTPFR